MTEQHLPSSLHKSACGDPASSFCSPPHSSSRPSRPLFPSSRSPSPSSSRPSCSRSPSPSSSRPSCSRSPSPSSSRPSCSRSPSPSSSGSSSLRRNSRNASDARSPPRKVSVRASSPNESQATNANGRGKEQETEASEKGDICRDLGRYVGGVRCWRWRRGCAQKFCSRKCRAEAEFLYHSRLCVGFSSAYVELLRLASEADNEYYVVAAKMFAGLRCMRSFSASARSRRQKQRESRPASGGRTACDAQEGPLQTNFRGEREAREDLQAARRLTPRSKRAPSGSTELNAKHRQRREENCETPRGARNSHGGSRESRRGERRQEREGGKEQGGTEEEEERQGKNGEENREAWVFPWAGWHQRPWWDTMKMPRYAASSTSEGETESSGEESDDESPSPSKVSTEVSSASREKPGALGAQNAEEYRHFYAAALAGAEEARRSLGLSNSRNSALSHTSSRSSPSSPISSRSSSRSSLSSLSPSSSSSSPSSRPSASRSRPCSLASSSPRRRTASREEKETPRQQAGDGTALIRRQLQERGERGEAGESKSRDLRRSPSSGLKKKRTRRSEIRRKARSRREEEAATESGCLRAMAHALICRGAKQAAEDAAHALLEETKQAKAARRSPELSGVPLLSLPPSLQEGNGADENVSEAEVTAAEAEGAAKQGDDASKRDEGEDSQNDEREQAKRRATRAAANCSLEQFFRSQIRKQTREVLSVLAQLLPELSQAGILTLRNFSNVIGLIRMNATAYRVDHHDLASLLQAASAQKGETKKNERPGGEETKSPESGERQANEAGSRARKRQELAASNRGRIEERRPREERRHSGDRARRRRGDRRGRKTSPDFHAQVAEYGCSSADLLPDRNSQTDLSSLCSVEGLALFPIQSCMNHACLPNCRWFLQETPLAGRDAHRAAGEGPRDKARRRKTKSRRTEELPGVPAAATSERTEEGKSSRGAEKGFVMQDTEDMEEETAHRGEDEEDACEVHSLHETRRVFSRIWPLTPSYFRLAIVACRAILPGEELSADYFRPCETRERRVFLEPGAGPPSLELSVLSPCLPEKAEPAADAVCGDPADDARAEEPPTANQSGRGVGEERPQTAETEESAEQEERGERENRRFQRMHNGEGGNGASGDRGSQLSTNGGLLALPPFLKNRYECMTHQYRFQCSCILCRDASAGWRLIQAGALTLEDCENFAREQKWKAAAEEEKREKLGSPVFR